MVAWTLYSSLWGYSKVYYKSTGYGGTNGYSFRQSQPAGISAAAITDWNIYPNPATDLLKVSNPLADGAKYEITDMPGHGRLDGADAAAARTVYSRGDGGAGAAALACAVGGDRGQADGLQDDVHDLL